MPFVLLILGMLFLVVAIRGTQGTFFTLLKSEFVGNNSFVVWGAALVILGLVAYIRPIRPAIQALMGLILLVIFLANKGGVFSQFNNAIRNPATINAPTSGGVATDITGSGVGANTGGLLGTLNALTGSGPAGTPTLNSIVSGGITGMQGSNTSTYNPLLWSPGQ